MAYKHSHINAGREGHKGYPCPLTEVKKVRLNILLSSSKINPDQSYQITFYTNIPDDLCDEIQKYRKIANSNNLK